MGFEYIFSGFVVGILVGLTGVGGGSLMTPLLVLVFKFPPAIAVGTDLLYAAITKSFGVINHNKRGHINWKIVGYLMLGSIPASFLMNLYIQDIDINAKETADFLEFWLGIALIFTSVAVLSQPLIQSKSKKNELHINKNPKFITIVLGLLLGSMVTLTSVGAGAMGITALLLIYPKMKIKNIIGTDIAHAVLLTLFAGLGHYQMGNVDSILLISLLVGSIPGVWIGSNLSSKINENKLRFILVIILLGVGAELILN